MFGFKSCHVRIAIDTAVNVTFFRSAFSSVHAKTISLTNGHMYAFSFIFQIDAFSMNTLSQSRTDTVISRSPLDASHLPSSIHVICYKMFCSDIVLEIDTKSRVYI